MQYGKNDLIREFEFEHARCQHYFELMYKVIQFTFAAIIAVVVVVFQGNSNEQYGALLLMLVLPVCIYVFGALYAFNAYALAVGGDRAEAIHEKIYENERETFLKEHDNMEDSLESFDKIFQSYVINSRYRSLVAYGVALGCFIVAPAFSIILGHTLFSPYAKWVVFISYFGLAVYLIIMWYIIIGIVKNHFKSSNSQEEAKLAHEKNSQERIMRFFSIFKKKS